MASRRVSVRTMDKQDRALQLYIARLTYQQIADMVGYSSRGAAHQAVTAALQRKRENMAPLEAEARTMALEELDALWRGSFPKAAKGDSAAALTCLRVWDRRARLNGLLEGGTPVEVHANVTANVQVRSSVDDQIEALVRQMEEASASAPAPAPASHPAILPD